MHLIIRRLPPPKQPRRLLARPALKQCHFIPHQSTSRGLKRTVEGLAYITVVTPVS